MTYIVNPQLGSTEKVQTIIYYFLGGQFTSWIVRWRMAILCEPVPKAFGIVREALGLSGSAKNSGWKIALNFLLLFCSSKKVSSKDARLLQVMVKKQGR